MCWGGWELTGGGGLHVLPLKVDTCAYVDTHMCACVCLYNVTYSCTHPPITHSPTFLAGFEAPALLWNGPSCLWAGRGVSGQEGFRGSDWGQSQSGGFLSQTLCLCLLCWGHTRLPLPGSPPGVSVRLEQFVLRKGLAPALQRPSLCAALATGAPASPNGRGVRAAQVPWCRASAEDPRDSLAPGATLPSGDPLSSAEDTQAGAAGSPGPRAGSRRRGRQRACLWNERGGSRLLETNFTNDFCNN